MKINKTKIKGVYVIDLEPRIDTRGYFTRVFAREILKKNSIKFDIVHINRSLTRARGTIRGIHFQIKPSQEDKLVQCLKGKIFDVAVDLRPKSKTFGKWIGIELSGDNQRMILIPKGCGHAFQTLEKNCVVEYLVSEYYSPKDERGIKYNDPYFRIEWPIKRAVLSEKDQGWPLFKSIKPRK